MNVYGSHSVGISVDARLLHDGQELSLTYLTISVLVELIDHRLELVIRKVLLHLAGNSAKVPQRDTPSVILIKKLERLTNLLNGIPLTNLGGHDLQKVRVLNLSRTFSVILTHEIQHLLLFDVEAEGAHAYL